MKKLVQEEYLSLYLPEYRAGHSELGIDSITLE